MPDVKLGAVDRSVLVFVPDPASTDGSGKTGLVAANLTVSYTRVETDNDVVVTDVTSSLSNLSALTDAHADWGLKEVSSTLAPGLYRLDIADAVFASGAWYAVVYVMITTSAAAASPILFTLIAFDPLDAVRLGLTALPNAAADAAGGLIVSDAGGLDADAQRADVVAILVDTGTTLQGEVDGIQADTEDIQTRLPAALVSGRIDSSVGAMAANVMTAAAAAADLTIELQSGLATAAALAVVDGIVDEILVDTGTTLQGELDGIQVKTDNLPSDPADESLIMAATDAIMTRLGVAGAGLTALGDVRLTNLDATISSRLASASYTTPPTVGAIADQVWEEAIADHSGTAGSTAEALAAAGSAGDPWVTALPGAYGAGSAGKILGDNLNATVSSRATPAQVNTEADTALVDAGVTTTRTGYLDNLSAGPAALQGSVQYIFDALRSYFQLLVRKDAAIATDAALGLADLNLDQGSGPGAYDNTTDSVQALRDRGDSAWTTAIGFSTHSAADVWAVGARTLTAFDVSFKTGYALSAAGVQAIWDALTSALTTVGSIGKLIVDNLNATISSRLASASYTTPPTVGAIADQVWEEAIVDHSGTVGSTAEALAAAGSAGDPWVTALPGAYGAGSAGKILGDNLNATVSSRATQTSVDDVPTGSELATALAAGVNVTQINGTTLIGDGQIATPWGPA